MSFIVKVFAILNLCMTASAAEAKKEHREHGAHKHGHAELSIAFDGMKGKIDFKSPSDSIYGFEHAPKNDTEKKQQREGYKRLEMKFPEMVAFDPNLKCVFSGTKTATDQEEKSSHSETRIEFVLNCEKSPKGTTVKFDFKKSFPRLHEVAVTVLADDLQKSVEVGPKGASLDLN